MITPYRNKSINSKTYPWPKPVIIPWARPPVIVFLITTARLGPGEIAPEAQTIAKIKIA